jgi:hypothetical protein
MAADFLKSSILILLLLALSSFSFDKAEGWYEGGSKAKSYDMGIDKGAGQEGKNCASIKSKDRNINGFGTLMQAFGPDKYLGKKIRMTGFMKSKDVTSWAGFWLRIDQKDSKASLSFDNMHDRAIKGTTEWTKYEIVLEVPKNASKIAFGALLNGTGQIWFNNLNFEVADSSASSTGKPKDEPTNLNFEK